ncbi:hypothetical protein ABIB80_007811 [Bradyrhizobium sp. i1.15.2]
MLREQSECLAAFSVVEATRNRSPGVNSAAFRALSPNLCFASLKDMDFAVRCPLVRCLRLVFGFCPSTHAFARCYLQTPPRSGSPCTLLVTLPQVLSNSGFGPAVRFARLGRDRDGSWRGALGITQRQIPARMAGEGELRRRPPSELRVWSCVVVQRSLRTPTGPFFARFFIDIILGSVAEFAFMGPSTRLAMSPSAARGSSSN